MAYEKPVLTTLSFASPAIRSGGDSDGTSTKGTKFAESGTQSDGTTEHVPPLDGATATSSTSSAYEADE